MIHFFIGCILTTAFIMILFHARRKKNYVTWWKWLLTVLGFGYALFVLEVIVSFLEEGAGRAALVMGMALGLIAVIWAVLLARFVFARKSQP